MFVWIKFNFILIRTQSNVTLNIEYEVLYTLIIIAEEAEIFLAEIFCPTANDCGFLFLILTVTNLGCIRKIPILEAIVQLNILLNSSSFYNKAWFWNWTLMCQKTGWISYIWQFILESSIYYILFMMSQILKPKSYVENYSVSRFKINNCFRYPNSNTHFLMGHVGLISESSSSTFRPGKLVPGHLLLV